MRYSVSTVKEKLFLTNTTLGDSIREFLPYLRVYLTVIFIAFGPILLLVGLATGNIFRYASTAFFLALFPVFWGGVGAVTNFIVSHQLTYLRDIVEAAKYSEPTFNVEDYPYIVSALKEWLTIAGWAGSAVIALSLAIMTGSTYAFVRFAGGFVSGLAGAASGSAGGIAMGNISAGNVSTDNVSANNTSMNKWDSTSVFANGRQIRNTEIYSIFKEVSFINRNLHEDIQRNVKEHTDANIWRNINEHTEADIWKEVTERDIGAKISVNGQPVRAGDTLSAGHQASSGVSKTAGDSSVFDTGKSTGKTYTYGKNWNLSETGNRSNTGDITRAIAEHARLNVTGLESLTAGTGQDYNHRISDQSTVGSSLKGSDEQTHQGMVEAGVNVGVGTGGGSGGAGSGGAGAGGGRSNPLISLLKKFGGNVQIGSKDYNINRQNFTKAFDKAVQNADANQVAEFLRYAKQHGINLSSILDRSGQEALLSKLAYAFSQQAGVGESTGFSRSGQEFDRFSQKLNFGTNYQSNEQAFAGRNVAITRDALAGLFTQNRQLFDRLVERASSYLSGTPFASIGAEDYAKYKDSLEAGNYATAFSYGSAVIQEALVNPKFAEELRGALQDGRIKELETEVKEHTGEIRDRINAEKEAVNPQEVLNKEVQQKAEGSLERYRNRAEGIRNRVDAGYKEVKNKVSQNVESEKGDINAVKEQTDRAKEHLTQAFNHQAHQVNNKQQEIEKKANEPASPLTAGKNLWNKTDWLGKGGVVLATANAGLSAIKGAKDFKQVIDNIRNRMSKPPTPRGPLGEPVERYGTGSRLNLGNLAEKLRESAGKAGDISERIATRTAEAVERALPALETGARVLGRVAEPLAVAGLVIERMKHPDISITSAEDIDKLQEPYQWGYLGSYLIQKVGDDRYSVFTNSGIQEMNTQQVKELVNQYLSRELQNAKTEENQGMVIVNRNKLETTGSSVVIADTDKLSKLLSDDEEW